LASFRYRLQPVLRLREQMEGLRKSEMGRAVSEMERERAALLAIAEAKAESYGGFGEECAAGAPVSRVKVYGDFLHALRARERAQAEALRGAEERVEESRIRLVKAMQDKKIMQKFKQRKLGEFMREEARKEGLAVDEVVSHKYAEGR